MYAMSVSWLTWGEAKSQVFWSQDMDMDDHSVGEVVVGNATSEATERERERELNSLEVVQEMICISLV